MNKEWLDSLKVGDRVVVHNEGSYYGEFYRIGSVVGISPKRNKFSVRFRDGVEFFDAQGTQSRGGKWGTIYEIEAVSDKVSIVNNRHNLIKKLYLNLVDVFHEKMKTLTDDQISKIVAILGKEV